jgi:oxalate decarboxylase/phosphoglucose isomerase-like protein (cupin superfamily)
MPTQFTFPDGKTQTLTSKAGDTMFTPAATHLPENMGDSPFDVVVVELKGKSTKAAKKAMQ